MSYRHALSTVLLNTLSSPRLALVLVLLVIVFSLAGAILPQHGGMDSADIAAWQKAHPVITSTFKPIGAFNVFRSWPFLVIILLLAINTLTCTIFQFKAEGRFYGHSNISPIAKLGFLLLHLSIIAILICGFYTAATGLDGRVILTEGQSFTEEHDSYQRLVEGPLRGEQHRGFTAKLKKVQTQYQKQHLLDITSEIEIYSGRNKITDGIIKVNYPFIYDGISFTYDDNGFAPRLLIQNKNTGRVIVDSFVALKTFRQGTEIEYRDFLPLPFFEHQTIVTVYPSFTRNNGKLEQTGQQPDNPLVLVETTDDFGQVLSLIEVPLGEKKTLGEYDFTFKDLRRWASFRIVEDRGYLFVCISLWSGVASLFLRYIPDMLKWFKVNGNQQG